MRSKLLTVIFFIFLSLLLIGCNGNTPQAPSQNGDTPPAPEETKGLCISKEGELLSVIILPENATEDEKNIASRLSGAIFQCTHKQISVMEDKDLKEAPEGAIIVGKTSLSESTDAYSSLPKRAATVKVADGRLVVAFTGYSAGSQAANELIAAIKGDYRSTVYVPLDFFFACSTLPSATDVPTYGDGKSYSCGAKTDMIYADATSESFREYCVALGSAGFVAVSEREVEENLFATFVGEDVYVYAYYTAYSESIRIITGPREELADEDYSSELPMTHTPYIASIPQPDNGQGYVIKLPDGRFIIQDGGYSGDDRVYDTLRRLEPDGRIVIAAWIISHPHADHYPAFTDFIKTHRNDTSVVIERVMLNFTDDEWYKINTDERTEDCSGDVNAFYKAQRTYAPSLPVIKLHTGQLIDFGAATVEVLYTAEDIMPNPLPNVNDSSMVIRLRTGGQSFMMLADTCYDSGPILNDMWGNYLKSDIVQVAHHGHWPSVERIYHSIAAEVVLVPAVVSRYKFDISDTRWDEQTEAFLSYAVDLYTTCDETVIIEMPYKTINNKAEMIEYIKGYVPKEGEPTS